MIIADHHKTASVRIYVNDPDDPSYGIDWSPDFYDAGLCRNLNTDIGGDEPVYPYARLLEANGFDEDEPVYEVHDVDEAVDYAHDMIRGIGDFDEPHPEQSIRVTALHAPQSPSGE